VVVLAGAGTGKTRVIACRLAALLESDPQLKPDQILALTFSRRAAQEMRERIGPLLPGHSPDDLGIFTFHGFCHRFLQDHAVESGLPARFRLLDQTEAWVFFRALLPHLNLSYHWNLADPTGCIDGFLRFISRAKDELVSPGDVLRHARGLPDPQERARLEEVARVYQKYQEALAGASQLDFGDLVVQTVRILRERPAVLERLRAQYPAILVDEFQDTNVAQIALLKLLAGPGTNLCVVGDDDQAIYRFRGASFASFLLLKEAYPDLVSVRLTQNYRSNPQILGAAGRLIRHNGPDRYDPEKQLWTALPARDPVQVNVCRDEDHEAGKAVEWIRRLWESQPLADRSFSRIAVLYRAHAHRERLMRLLEEKGIPFTVRGGYDLLGRSEIRDVAAFLQVLQDPSDSIALFRLMSHPALGILPEDLLKISRWVRERNLPLERFLEPPAEGPLLSEETRRGLAALRSDLARARKTAIQDLEDLVHQIAERSFLRVLFLKEGPAAADPLKALGRFLRLTARFRSNHPEPGDLSSFLDYLDSLIRAGANDLGDEQEEAPGDRVQLMTVHQAKGLEFDWVILIGMTQGQFPGRSRQEQIPFPVELMKESLPQGDYHLQEERRLCYVACTRARQGLVLLTQERSRHRRSVFVQEMLAEPDPSVIRESEAEGESLPSDGKGAAGAVFSGAYERELLELADRLRALSPKDEEGYGRLVQRMTELAALLRGESARILAPHQPPGGKPWPVAERFSYTQLQTYRACPLKYLYAYIYRIPIRSTPQMLLGTDLHDALEWLYQRVIQGAVPPLPEFLEFFRQLHRPRRYGDPREDAEYLRLGAEWLSAFYEKQQGNWIPPLFVEKEFTLLLEGVAIHGFMDRVDPLPDGGVRILDYKSGKPKEKATLEEQLQLWLYALAAQEVLHLEPRQVSFYYLRKNLELSFDRAPGLLEQTRERVLGTAREILSGRFTPTPSPHLCGRCDFRNLCPASMA